MKLVIGLARERKRKGLFQSAEEKVLCSEGPTFLAKQAIRLNTNFEQQVKNWKLDLYASGDFIKQSQLIYFVQQLQDIPANSAP
ncbi:hypothetical protein P4S73_02350 [Paraglaciecola sp. Hal342]